jgi:hypothetical protein
MGHRAHPQANGKLVKKKIDYSQQSLSISPLARATFGRCLVRTILIDWFFLEARGLN